MAKAKLNFELTVDDKGSVVVKKFGKTVDQTALKGKTFGERFKAAAAGVGKLAVTAGKAAVGMGAVATAMGTALAATGLKKFAEFEVAWKRIGNVSDESLEKVRAKIAELPKELGSGTELMKGYYQVLSAGIKDPIESMDMLVTSSRMAKEASIEQGEAVRGLASLLSAYKGELKDAGDAADLMYSIERSGITTISELIPHIGGLANLTKNAGLSATEMAGALAQITKSGAGTSESVTQLKSLIVGLLKPNEQMAMVFEKWGGTMGAIQKLGFVGTLQEIEKATGGNTDAIVELFGRKEAMLGMLQLMKGEYSGLNESIQASADRTGSAADAWERYKGTLKALWDTFKNTVGGQVTLIGERLTPAVKNLVSTTSDWLAKNKELISQKIEATIGNIADKVANLTDEDIGKWLDRAARGFDGVVKAAELASKVIGEIAAGLNIFYQAAKQVVEFTKNMVGADDAAKGVVLTMDEMAEITGKSVDELERMEEATRRAGVSAKDVAEANAQAEVERMQASMAAGDAAVNAAEKTAAAYGEATDAIGQTGDDLAAWADRVDSESAEAATALENSYASAAENVRANTGEMAQASADLADNVAENAGRIDDSLTTVSQAGAGNWNATHERMGADSNALADTVAENGARMEDSIAATGQSITADWAANHGQMAAESGGLADAVAENAGRIDASLTTVSQAGAQDWAVTHDQMGADSAALASGVTENAATIREQMGVASTATGEDWSAAHQQMQEDSTVLAGTVAENAAVIRDEMTTVAQVEAEAWNVTHEQMGADSTAFAGTVAENAESVRDEMETTFDAVNGEEWGTTHDQMSADSTDLAATVAENAAGIKEEMASLSTITGEQWSATHEQMGADSDELTATVETNAVDIAHALVSSAQKGAEAHREAAAVVNSEWHNAFAALVAQAIESGQAAAEGMQSNFSQPIVDDMNEVSAAVEDLGGQLGDDLPDAAQRAGENIRHEIGGQGSKAAQKLGAAADHAGNSIKDTGREAQKSGNKIKNAAHNAANAIGKDIPRGARAASQSVRRETAKMKKDLSGVGNAAMLLSTTFGRELATEYRKRGKSMLDLLKEVQDIVGGGSKRKGLGIGYAHGTGIAGAPADGEYKLHRGEIVLDPTQSEAMRRGAAITAPDVMISAEAPEIVTMDAPDGMRPRHGGDIIFGNIYVTADDAAGGREAGQALAKQVRKDLKRLDLRWGME